MTDSAKQDAAGEAAADQDAAGEAAADQDAAGEAAADQEDVTAAQAPDDGGHDAHADDADGKPDIDEVKRKFRAALDRKRETHAEGSGKGGQDTGKIHGAHGPARNNRQFRRKSG